MSGIAEGEEGGGEENREKKKESTRGNPQNTI